MANVALSSILLALVLLCFFALRSRFHPRSPLTASLARLPGPPRRLIIGNLLDLPIKHQWVTFTKWKKQYGDIVGLSVLGQPIVILNSRKAIQDLLDDRSANYSDRPPLTVMREWAGFDWALFGMPYNEEMHRQRRFMTQCIGPGGCKSYQESMHTFALEFAEQLYLRPSDFRESIKLLVASNLQRIAYGRKVAGLNDGFVGLINDMTESVDDLGAMGSHLVDIFPCLAKLPKFIFGQKMAKNVVSLRKIVDAVLSVPFSDAKNRIEQGTILKPSMVETLIELNKSSDGLVKNERTLQAVATVCYTAGFETVVSTIDSFFLTMSCFPSVQRKAQDCIDGLLSGERLPNFHDRESLPYVQAVFLEILRWGTAAPVALPHRSLTNDSYRGYLIPAGSAVIPNSWACLHDEDDYPNPMEFSPERFLTPDGLRLRDDVMDPRHLVFGYGRRVCPGRQIAEAITWITMTTVLATFTISKAKDDQGNEINPCLEYDNGQAASYPKPYSCWIEPRSQDALDLLQSLVKTW